MIFLKRILSLLKYNTDIDKKVLLECGIIKNVNSIVKVISSDAKLDDLNKLSTLSVDCVSAGVLSVIKNSSVKLVLNKE